MHRPPHGLHLLPGLESPQGRPLGPGSLQVLTAQPRMNVQNRNGRGLLTPFSVAHAPPTLCPLPARLALGRRAGEDAAGEEQGARGVSTADVLHQRGASAGDRGEGPPGPYTCSLSYQVPLSLCTCVQLRKTYPILADPALTQKPCAVHNLHNCPRQARYTTSLTPSLRCRRMPQSKPVPGSGRRAQAETFSPTQF